MTTKTVHNLKDRGAAFSPTNLTRIDPNSTAGIGVALCTCGWPSEVLPSGRARKAAHAEHKKQREMIADSDLPPEPSQFEEAGHPAGKGLDEPVDPVDLGDVTKERTITFDVQDVPKEAIDILTGVVATEARDWKGNYSIVFAPMTAELAAAYSDELKVEQKNVSAVLRHTYVSGPRQTVTNFLQQLDAIAEAALAELKVWQKENIAERRGLTDMQKFLQHREFLANFGHRAAKRIQGDK